MFKSCIVAIGGDGLYVAGEAQYPIVSHHLSGHGAGMYQGHGERTTSLGNHDFRLVVGHLVGAMDLGVAVRRGPGRAGKRQQQGKEQGAHSHDSPDKFRGYWEGLGQPFRELSEN